ncbi:Phage protein [Yersinia phage fHe-Yen9-04]|uniref:Phage protein n=2 Tax=Eneladusvirus Yen904 TaxID=2560849 RepID=A0A2C9CX14_9CAUD|nr:starvation-inducible transcriptional regulator [Yersinia phage fHe-Yen9-04]SOK58439.1 Phage protein [Yersinia phage fHe-Yen9-04]SOK58973.1 Phage protein [Yersinia phage fHe-Yen9-03]VUE36208.1 Phage protein [Yersinia phage fHe-Yen9-04]
MSEHFDPNDIRSMMDYVETTGEDTHEDVLIKFVENSLFLESQAHHWHLQCKYYSKHMELDEFYKDLPEFVDSFIEGMMAERGPIFSTGTSYVFQPLEAAIPILEEYVQHCNKIHEILDSLNEIGSVNTLEDIISFINSILYKLKVLQ